MVAIVIRPVHPYSTCTLFSDQDKGGAGAFGGQKEVQKLLYRGEADGAKTAIFIVK